MHFSRAAVTKKTDEVSVKLYMNLHNRGRLLLHLNVHMFPVVLELHSRDPKIHYKSNGGNIKKITPNKR